MIDDVGLLKGIDAGADGQILNFSHPTSVISNLLYRCTLPLASPLASVSTSSSVTRL